MGLAWAGAAWLILVNLGAALMMWADKRRAGAGRWRIPESKLLFAAAIGGWPAAKWAQSRFRHKTRKQPFAGRLNRIPLFWLAAAALFSVPRDVYESLLDALRDRARL